MRRLRTLALVSPIVFLLALEAIQYFFLEPHFSREVSHLFTVISVLLGIVVFTQVIWSAIERAEDQLRQALETERVAEERERIAMDLHDGVTQKIYGVGLTLERATDLIEENPQEAQDLIEASIDQLGDIAADIRHYILDLRHRPMGQKAFPSLLYQLLASAGLPAQTTKEFFVSENLPEIPRHWQWELWHIAHEALSNVARHSGATHLKLTFEETPQGLRLSVWDNGRGFPVTREKVKAWLLDDGRGQGLSNMRYRAESLGGRLEIESRPGGGTTITALLPPPPPPAEEEEEALHYRRGEAR
ncbi:MAG: sensor histidine kinase [Bacillota bacterium]|nr:sensor histidine kinase [Bacillota bacterium]